MSIIFKGIELINIAIGIEGRGVAFYEVMARSTGNATARDVFQHLADMERQHIQIFQEMLKEADKYQVPESIAEEYASYFQVLIDSAVFTDDFITSEMANQVSSDVEALELAMSAEKESILFYYEMRDIMPRRASPVVNGIINEEKSHLRQLSELKKKLAAI